MDHRPRMLLRKRYVRRVPHHCPAAHQPRTSHPSCPLLPALPRLPSKAIGETPVPLSSQHKGRPHDPPQASPDTQQEQASSMWPMGAPACVAAGTATTVPPHTPQPHKLFAQSPCAQVKAERPLLPAAI